VRTSCDEELDRKRLGTITSSKHV
ncbi:hypothetical protein CSUI_001553, partial [Cystoisospora suis]